MLFFITFSKGFQIIHVEKMIDDRVAYFKTISTVDRSEESGASAMQKRSGCYYYISLELHTIFRKISMRPNYPKCQIMLLLQIKLFVKNIIKLIVKIIYRILDRN